MRLRDAGVLLLTNRRQSIGHTRYGDTLLDSIHKTTAVDEAELKAVLLTFAEQAKEGACALVIDDTQLMTRRADVAT